MFAKSLADFLEEVPSSTRDFLFKLTFLPHIGSLFYHLCLEMYLKKVLLLENRAFLDKKVSILNLVPPDLLLDETLAQVSAKKTAAIEDMIDMPTAKRSKMSTSMSTIGRIGNHNQLAISLHPETTRTGMASVSKGPIGSQFNTCRRCSSYLQA
eukprot:4146146-Ditylum_brightwellii.AAC.1